MPLGSFGPLCVLLEMQRSKSMNSLIRKILTENGGAYIHDLYSCIQLHKYIRTFDEVLGRLAEHGQAQAIHEIDFSARTDSHATPAHELAVHNCTRGRNNRSHGHGVASAVPETPETVSWRQGNETNLPKQKQLDFVATSMKPNTDCSNSIFRTGNCDS